MPILGLCISLRPTPVQHLSLGKHRSCSAQAAAAAVAAAVAAHGHRRDWKLSLLWCVMARWQEAGARADRLKDFKTV